jgi:hypothetical protein
MSNVDIVNLHVFSDHSFAVNRDNGFVLTKTNFFRKLPFEVPIENGRYQTASMQAAIIAALTVGSISKDENGNPLSLDELKRRVNKQHTVRIASIIIAFCFALALVPFIPLIIKAL